MRGNPFETRLAAIRARLDRLRALDVHLRIFGAGTRHGHHYRERPPLDDTALATLEAAYGVPLPDELRAFLGRVHGGGPGPGYGLTVDPAGDPRAAAIWPYGQADLDDLLARRAEDPYASLDIEETEDGRGWPPGRGFIALAEHGCGVVDVIVVTGELRGTMWCCDMAWRPYACGFLDWYEGWLDANLDPRAVAGLTAPE